MKIAEITCKSCKAQYETIESYPKEALECPSCGGKDFDYKLTDREFEGGCGGGCDSCGGGCSN